MTPGASGAAGPLGEMERARLVALALLEGFGPVRLRVALEAGPTAAWAHVASGREPDGSAARGAAAAAWPAALRHLDPAGVWERHRDAGVVVTVLGDPGHPVGADDGPDAPPLLFWRGPTAPSPPSAASAPLAVVAGGLDVVYPARNRELWRAVERRGVVVGECPLGVRPERWRFPARNRVIVALSDLVVVVESHDAGGSLLTAGFAGDRGVPVMAVPGPVTSAASAGTNSLLVDGCAPCLGIDDVMMALGFSGGARGSGVDPGVPALAPTVRAVLDALPVEGAGMGELVDVLDLPLAEVSLALEQLQGLGLARAEQGRFAPALGP